MTADVVKLPPTAEQLAAFEFEPLTAKAAAGMYHDFSADPWASECAEHGVALRFAYAIMTQTKAELVGATEQLETDFPPPQSSPTAGLCETLKHSRERLAQLVGILETAEARQISAAAVVELRMMARAGDDDGDSAAA